jgi:hypothetical protein
MDLDEIRANSEGDGTRQATIGDQYKIDVSLFCEGLTQYRTATVSRPSVARISFQRLSKSNVALAIR